MATGAFALNLTFHENNEAFDRIVAVDDLVIAGWTGRDKEALEHHIAELELLGVKRPKSVPIYYRASVDRLTTKPVIQVLGSASSGEVEPVIVKAAGKLWLGVGSDHTDREVETYNITVSKQMCDKPIAPSVWLLDDVLPHWDQLRLTSYIEENGQRVAYQQGTLGAITPPLELIRGWPEGEFTDGTVMFCGTFGAIGGIRSSNRFEVHLEDPVLGRALSHSYEISSLLLGD